MALPLFFTPRNMGAIKFWRNAPSPSANWRILAYGEVVDLTGALLLMQVRMVEGTPGDPALDLSSAVSTGDYISILAGTAGLFLPVVRQATLEAMPSGSSAGKPSGKSFETFSFDLKLGTTTANARVVAYGQFLLETGVTR